jgi:iron-sulfur cluster assembly protein
MGNILIDSETNTATAPVKFIEGAIKEINKLLSADDFPQNQALRVGVKGGGCSGMTYVLGFDERTEDDDEFIIDGIRVFMNRSHQMYLFGMQIDFQQGLNSRGFVFENPNATKTCGCGSSFSA